MKETEIGAKRWAFSAGHIPLQSTGREPEFVSQDRLAILNCTKEDAALKITIYFTDQEPVGEYEIKVKAQRMRKFRVNDLIDPRAIELGVPYGCLLESDVPVVVQFTRQHTAQKALALMGTTAFPAS
jgi:hypothetical protein